MAQQVFCTEGVVAVNDLLLARSVTMDAIKLHLYVDDNSVVATDTFQSHTLCTLAGYAAASLNPVLWTVDPQSGYCDNLYPPVFFSFQPYTGGVTIHGTLIGVEIDNVEYLWYGARLDTPFAVPSLGGVLQINLNQPYGGCGQVP